MRRLIIFLKFIILVLCLALLVWGGYQGYDFYQRTVEEQKILNQIIERLSADSRIAEVLVTGVEFDPITQKKMTTIKFLEYNSVGEPLEPKYFTFVGNIIQFQSLVVRFEDEFIRSGEALRGKSVYLFWKVFVLDGDRTQSYNITEMDAVPAGYRVRAAHNEVEQEIWQRFWDYALNSKHAVTKGIKNAQIEAPGTRFVPGILYTLKIEHDGGIRIDHRKIPAILRGETIY